MDFLGKNIPAPGTCKWARLEIEASPNPKTSAEAQATEHKEKGVVSDEGREDVGVDHLGSWGPFDIIVKLPFIKLSLFPPLIYTAIFIVVSIPINVWASFQVPYFVCLNYFVPLLFFIYIIYFF